MDEWHDSLAEAASICGHQLLGHEFNTSPEVKGVSSITASLPTEITWLIWHKCDDRMEIFAKEDFIECFSTIIYNKE